MPQLLRSLLGSNCGHLDETIFGDELMTPRLNDVRGWFGMVADIAVECKKSYTWSYVRFPTYY